MKTFEKCMICQAKIEKHVLLEGKYNNPQISPSHLSESDEFSQCQICEHVFLNPIPDFNQMYVERKVDELPSEYSKVNTDFYLQLIKKYYGNQYPKRILDYGCGHGEILKEFSLAGMEAVGYDPSLEHVEHIKKLGLQCHSGKFSDIKDEISTFDCVFINHVLEHLEDPVKHLKSLQSVLNDKAIVFISVPNFASKSVGYDSNGHIHYFKMLSFKKMIEAAGFDSVKLFYSRPLMASFNKIFGRGAPLIWSELCLSATALLSMRGYSLTAILKAKKNSA